MQPEQVIAAVRFDPLLPVWILAVLGALCLAVLAVGAWRRARGTALRLAAFSVLLLWLSGPRLVQETRDALRDIGLLVVDQSASMQVGDRARQAEAARQAIEAQAARLRDLDLRTITVPESGSNGTQLFSAVDRALADIPRSRLAGTIAITDGQIHDVPKASPGGAPLNLLLAGKGEETDRRLRVIEAPGYGIVGKSVFLRVAIDDLGTPAALAHDHGPATLTIRRDGQTVSTESVPVGVEQPIEVPITRAGPTVIEMAASPLPGEVSQLNNRAVVEINGVRDRLRVLLISGEPHQGERTWRRLLKADPSVDLVHFTILRPPEKDDRTPLNELALIAFPVRELFVDKIGEFDLIILDRFQNRGLLPLPYLANIASRVRQGGALLMSVGPEFAGAASLAATPLGSVLPGGPARSDAVVEGQFRPWVTDLGQRHPVTEGLPGANPPGDAKPPEWGSWYRRIEPNSMTGEVLMRSPDGQPLLSLDRVGQGRTALLLSDQIWLWSRGHQGGGPQAELLRRIAHWLMQEPELEENALTARVTDGRLRIESRSTDPTPPMTVAVTDPDGRTETIALHQDAPGRATAIRVATVPGVWKVSQGERSAYAAAGAANPPELADLRATATVAGSLARASDGGVHWIGNGDIPELRRTEEGRAASGSGWIGLERRHDHVVTGVAALDLLPGWVSLPVMLGLLLLAWRREGR
ncbi:hypothetical protein [Rhodopila globiformis]|uniref:Glutamine amidotransferase domain-containing protein n=1 Tax=Rhodopila globiformis TaxID=1071 RepID=A0A2S6NN90_RHOGL|nr:hypothetical protein [Rhodopila globiformis]PPQ38486.1 hypothetical protein CCS01_02195 [Rhodopila globiformis]